MYLLYEHQVSGRPSHRRPARISRNRIYDDTRFQHFRVRHVLSRTRVDHPLFTQLDVISIDLK